MIFNATFLLQIVPEFEDSQVSSGVEKELGRSLAQWYPVGGQWQSWHYDMALMAGTPVLAHMPPAFIYRMTPQVMKI